MSIKLTDAAKFFKEEEHQIEAWTWLQGTLSPEALETFAFKYRNKLTHDTFFGNTWESIYKIAKKAGAKFPEVVAAQWALESGWGRYTSGKNNFFGLKGTGSTVNTKEFINGQWITIKADFLDFPDIATCVTYLVDRWYKDYKNFKGVNRADSRNECAQLLVKEGFATDPDYATKLIQIMDRQLDKAPASPGIINERILSVPYFYQLDNESGKGSRECFSSSCAMLAAFYNKVNTDDEYNKIRKNFGDTTNALVQLTTLRHLGLSARLVSNGNSAVIENEIRNGRPIAVGWLHQGNVVKPSGGGHWSIIRGFTPTHFVHGDPYGEADMIKGGYVSTNPKAGDGIRYSRKNWLRRWEVEGPNTGWAILVNK